MKMVWKYSIIFFLFLFVLFIPYTVFFGDSIVNYGFSYAIVNGEVPYQDFNLILPLFSPFFYAIPIYFFPSYITFYVTQAGLLTGLFYFLEKRLSYKVYFFFFFLFLGHPLLLPTGLFPGYNFLLFLFILLLVWCEEKEVNDYWIGILLGLSVITKHTIGVFLFLPSFFFYFKDLKKIGKRLLGSFVPISIFIIYLLLTKTISQFWDLCVLGIFDFASQNHVSTSVFLILTLLVGLFYGVYLFFREKKISIFYLLLTALFVVPLFDEYHFSYFVYAIMILFLERLSMRENLKYVFMVLCIIMIGVWSFITCVLLDNHFYFYKTYPLRYMSPEMRENYQFIDSFEKETDKEVILFLLGTENYFYKITNHQKITYFDLPNYGNYGCDGTSKMKNRIDGVHDAYFIVSTVTLNDYRHQQQYYRELVQYVIEKGTLIKENQSYSIYYVE